MNIAAMVWPYRYLVVVVVSLCIGGCVARSSQTSPITVDGDTDPVISAANVQALSATLVLDYIARIDELELDQCLSLLARKIDAATPHASTAQRLEIDLILRSISSLAADKKTANQLARFAERLSSSAPQLAALASRIRRQLLAHQAREAALEVARERESNLREELSAVQASYKTSTHSLREAQSKIQALTTIEEEIERTEPATPAPHSP